jgi:hypothetical protein
MSDPFENSTALVERLVAKVTRETDSVKSDELCTGIWRVLSERERPRQISGSSERALPLDVTPRSAQLA